jgi:hypothetical protein
VCNIIRAQSPPEAAPLRPGWHHGLLGRTTYSSSSRHALNNTHWATKSPPTHGGTARRVNMQANHRAPPALPLPDAAACGRTLAASARPQLARGSRDENATKNAPQQHGGPTCGRARRRGICEHGIMLGMGWRTTGRCGKHLRARNRRLHRQEVDHPPPLTLLRPRAPAPRDFGYLLSPDALESSDANWIRL